MLLGKVALQTFASPSPCLNPSLSLLLAFCYGDVVRAQEGGLSMSKAGEGSELSPRLLRGFRGCCGWVLQLENCCRGALCQQTAGRFSPPFLQLKGTSVQGTLWSQLCPPLSKSCAGLQTNVLGVFFLSCCPDGLGLQSTSLREEPRAHDVLQPWERGGKAESASSSPPVLPLSSWAG